MLYQLGGNPPADIASGRIAEVRSRSMSCNCMTRTSQQECRGILECVRMQTSTEKKQSGIEVGVRAMKKKRGARCLQQTDSPFYPPIDFKDFPLYTHVVSLPGTIVTI